jgi:hypothetical protein
MKSKLIAIPYTIGIIKPHIALKEEKVQISSLTIIGPRDHGDS